MLRDNEGRVRLVIRHIPLHPGAGDVVRALEASRKQGRYWQTLEALLSRQDRWVENHVASIERAWGLLAESGLNVEQLKADMNDPEVVRNVQTDTADAKALNVTMTPEYFVNGRPLPSFGLEQLRGLVAQSVRDAY
jgi:protein-disulfide isomerase